MASNGHMSHTGSDKKSY
jgi:uncharacterized protein YkwD